RARLAEPKLLGEAWAAAGPYQPGSFPGRRWSEWNGRFGDDIRRFVRGDPGLVGAVATRVSGSSDLYAWSRRPPQASVNFITCHDGFTLRDLVSYNAKHNEANAEQNRDGETGDPAVEALRARQVRTFERSLLLA